ncbi:MAG: hypothetical protein KAI08_06660 [Bacteroidales bacterium]|nr:hypothetical protein [Bacteroidales bacterium]
MNTLSIIGATIVTLALISYSIGIISEQVKKKIIPRVLIFITLGVALDITATAFMILGSKNSPFTAHGFIGYSALVLMLIELVRIWRSYNKLGMGADVPKGVHLYSRYAYIWWVIAYITGSLIAMT